MSARSHHTTKDLAKLRSVLDDEDVGDVTWSPRGTSFSVANVTDFSRPNPTTGTSRLQELFGIKVLGSFSRKYHRLGFESTLVGRRSTFRHPNFTRDHPQDAATLRSQLEDSHASFVAAQEGPRCTCQACEPLLGRDGAERVWYADNMCNDCIEFTANLSKTDPANPKLGIGAGFFVLHLEKEDHRRVIKQPGYDRVKDAP